MNDYKLLKIITNGLLVTLVLTLVIFFDRTTGREIFITIRSLVIVALLILLSRNTRRRTKEIIYKGFDDQYKEGSSCRNRYFTIQQYKSDIYKLSYFAWAAYYILISASISICVGVMTDKWVFRMFLTTFFLFILLGCQLENKYVRKRTNRINNNI